MAHVDTVAEVVDVVFECQLRILHEVLNVEGAEVSVGIVSNFSISVLTIGQHYWHRN